jgi:hypothetical protein
MELDREPEQPQQRESEPVLIAKPKAAEVLMLVRKAGLYCVFLIWFSVAACGDVLHSTSDGFEHRLQQEWHQWCETTKQELVDFLVFDAIAEWPDAKVDINGIDFVGFEDLRIPIFVDEMPEIVVSRTGAEGIFLRISYESGLRIVAFPAIPNPIDNVFERLMPEVTEGIEAYVLEKYGSVERFTSSNFGAGADFVHLRFEGHKFTTKDIECTSGIDETLRKIPLIMASASSDYAAMRAGENIAYWSKNNLPGVVTRQQTQFSSGEQGLSVIWSGDFIDEERIWQVIISFDVEHQDRYDRLGLLLANPSLK